MCFDLMKKSLRCQADITSTERLVLILLADYANSNTKLCFPSQSRMARELGVSRKHINRSIANLKLKGLIKTHPIKGGRSVGYDLLPIGNM